MDRIRDNFVRSSFNVCIGEYLPLPRSRVRFTFQIQRKKLINSIAQVGLHFFPASTTRCLLEPWFRELGFIVCYGSIILKLYRHLVEFRTRKAHRWVLRDVDLLKYLSTMIFAVICYMSAFTASSLDLIKTAGLDGLQEVNTNTCQPMKWEFVTQSSEILILAFGLHLAIASRNATTQFRVNIDPTTTSPVPYAANTLLIANASII